MKESQKVRQLERKLEVQNSYIDKLSMECIELKSKANKVLLNVRSMEAIPKYVPQSSPKSSNFLKPEPQNSAQVLKRYHKLQEENKKYSKKNEGLRNQIQGVSLTNSKLSKQNNLLNDKLKSYETMINKQFEIIENQQKQFGQEIREKTHEFKERIIELRESLSPGKQLENVKTIESLQNENKSLKRKFQLCSVELTKCFKTLEIYKRKLNEYEQQYIIITNEKQQLIQKIGRLSNNGKDKSPSRCSMSRISQTDRRKSMGQTGNFNHN